MYISLAESRSADGFEYAVGCGQVKRINCSNVFFDLFLVREARRLRVYHEQDPGIARRYPEESPAPIAYPAGFRRRIARTTLPFITVFALSPCFSISSRTPTGVVLRDAP
jgi:hypothetical protein